MDRVRWPLGIAIGTLIIACTSPLFVRSYPPRMIDPVRQQWTYVEGSLFRWRSEGYATTWIGPHGMPGFRVPIPPPDKLMTRVALWGDSQAEGVCVSDEEKIFAQANQLVAHQSSDLVVFPLARSGDQLSDWIDQMPRVEQALHTDAHAILIVELDDLQVNPVQSPATTISSLQQQFTQIAPAFVVQAIRNIVTDSAGSVRGLRFQIGPLKNASHLAAPSSGDTRRTQNALQNRLESSCQAIRHATTRPVVLLFAPLEPVIMGGEIRIDDQHPLAVEALRVATENAGIHFVDLRATMREAADRGQWPRGFQNGQFGVGHYNQLGNRLIAEALVDAIESLTLKN
jgi:hypothetical protein